MAGAYVQQISIRNARKGIKTSFVFLLTCLVAAFAASGVFAASRASITSSPGNVRVSDGQTATFSVNAVDAVSYSWQYTYEEPAWSPISANDMPGTTGERSPTVSVPADSSMDGMIVRVVVTGSDGVAVVSRSATLTVTGALASQSLAFNNPGTQSFGTTPTLTAAATSGLTVAFSSSTTGVCTISSGGALTFTGTGTCTISANQAGDNTYSAAPTVSQSFSVNAVLPGAPTVGTATASDGQATVSFTAPSGNGGATIVGYTVTASPGGATASGSVSPITLIGLTNGTIYSFTVTATNSAGTGPASSASNSITPKAAQMITFPNPGAQNFGEMPTLTATASSGLTPIFISSTTAVCTITNGGALTFVSIGTCTIDADQAGNVANLPAPTVSQSFSVNAVIPGAPTIGTATAGDGQATVTFTAPSNIGGTTITSYTVTSSPGGFTATGLGSPITIAGLTNDTAYSFTVAATNNVGNGSTSAASNSVTPRVALQAPVANPVSATVAGNAGATAITLNITGGSASSVAVAAQATHGTAVASGTSITYTPMAGYSGSDSLTYTATNSSGSSAAATVAITVSAPLFTFTPSSAVLASGTVAAVYTQTVDASGGTAPYSYTYSGAVPPGLTLNTMTGVISGAPTTTGTYNFTITATDANHATGSTSYSIVIGDQAPVAGAASATVAANSSANPITLNITGGAAASVAVATQATHGTATATGTTIIYSPTAGFSGSDSFTYTAANASGTSAAATVAITVSGPTLAISPAGGTLQAGTSNTAYSQAIMASGGAAPYNYAVSTGTLPTGLTLNASTGAITGTPTAAGNYNFAIAATDANAASATAAYSLTINPTAVATFTFLPPGGPLIEAMAGEAYNPPISVAGGTSPLTYSIASGSLPPGMILNVSTGALSGSLNAGTEGDYGFTLQVRDAQNATGTASYTLHVKSRAVTVDDKVVNVAAGSTPANVNLAAGATGGPFVSGDLTYVVPANAGSASIVNGEFAQAGGPTPTGWYLKFNPNPAYSGQVHVGFRLTSALGISNTATVIYNIGYDPAKVATHVDSLVHDFIEARQNLIASTIRVPGLLERRQVAKSTDPVTTRIMPSEQGMTLGFSTSLAQIEAARKNDGVASGEVSPFNIWIDSTFLAHNDKEVNGSKWGSFAMVSVGTDYLLSEKILIGLSFHYEHMIDPTDEDATLTGSGWLAGPYASFEIGKGVFWDTSLFYGGSSNKIDKQFWDGSFDTTRWMLDTSINGQWNLDEVTTVTPKLRTVYFSETVEEYSVTNGQNDQIGIEGFTEKQLRASLGAEIARQFTLENEMKLTPKLGLTGGFSGINGSGAFGQVSSGLSLNTLNGLSVDAGILFNFAANDEKSLGAKAGISGRF